MSLIKSAPPAKVAKPCHYALKGRMIDFILVRPQMGENIGMAARAMLNCGFDRLVLVEPRPDWSRDAAIACSAGASSVVENAAIYPDLAAALAPYTLVYASTARMRDVHKPVQDLRDAAAAMNSADKGGGRVAVLFGPERTGLTNEDVSLCSHIVTIPLNPAYASLNVAQAVLLVAYALWQPDKTLEPTTREAATNGDYQYLFQHLERELDAVNFWQVPEKRARMVDNLRALLLRAGMSRQEVQTLHGVITALRQTT